jgi:acyl carrier protein
MELSDADATLQAIHEEVRKYVDREFDDTEHFQRDLKIPSDDLTAIVLELEKRFGLKIERRLYRSVNNVAEYAELVRGHLG